jgi:hypothetical protein
LLALVLGLLAALVVVAGPAARSIGGTVFFDHDGNGQQDVTDEGLAGVTVILQGPRGLVTTTGADGSYLFARLPAGTYRVTEVNRDGYLSTTPDTVPVELAQKVKQARVDFGDALPVSVYGAVFRDDNLNRQFDYWEPGIGGVGVTIYQDADGDGVLDPGEPALARTQTDFQGNYLFTSLLPGRVIMVETDPPGYGSTTPNAVPLTLVSSEASGGVEVNFGDVLGSIGDTVWLDSDGDGVYEPEVGEVGLGGVKVILAADFNRDGIVDFTTFTATDADGIYLFRNLPAGRYTVNVDPSTLPAGLTPTCDLDGIGTPDTATLTLGAGQNRTDVDFGYRPITPPGTAGPGYWASHPEAWPVSSMTIGGATYTQEQAIEIILSPTAGDVTYVLAQALIAAKLNVGVGNDSTCIEDTIRAADAWLAAQGGVGGGVPADDPGWREGELLYQALDAYNNGWRCAPPRT